jgi:hypothetical protein
MPEIDYPASCLWPCHLVCSGLLPFYGRFAMVNTRILTAALCAFFQTMISRRERDV